MFCSCEGLGAGSGGSSFIVGSWVVDDDYFNPNEVDRYIEFSKGGVLTEYYVPWSNYEKGIYPTFSNGTLKVPSGMEWEYERSADYSVKGNAFELTLGSLKLLLGTIKKLDSGTFVLDCDDSEIDGTYHRIKKFSTK